MEGVSAWVGPHIGCCDFGIEFDLDNVVGHSLSIWIEWLIGSQNNRAHIVGTFPDVPLVVRREGQQVRGVFREGGGSAPRRNSLPRILTPCICLAKIRLLSYIQSRTLFKIPSRENSVKIKHRKDPVSMLQSKTRTTSRTHVNHRILGSL